MARATSSCKSAKSLSAAGGQKVAYLVECNRVASEKPDEESDDDEIEGLGTATMDF
ncbi:hypothetical protein CU097_015226 [Rhizopus azygosporus]|uniref:Uncharacterized protein n=1 Tax=Rhizopus azygosporus TaxID=86630 RepID=A0A367KBG3_RHIAZ|nr:hypothetical protein CU097_015226 [Rhizopus azygosporus]